MDEKEGEGRVKKASAAKLDASSELSGTGQAGNKMDASNKSDESVVTFGSVTSGPKGEEKTTDKEGPGKLEGFLKSIVRGHDQAKLNPELQVKLSPAADDTKGENDAKTSENIDNKVKTQPVDSKNTKVDSNNHKNGVEKTIVNQEETISVKRNQAEKIDAPSKVSLTSIPSQKNYVSMREENFKILANSPTDPILVPNNPSRILLLDSNSYSNRLTSYSLMFGLPLLGLIMIALLFCILVRFFRNLFKWKSNSKMDNKSSGIGFQPDNKKHHSPIGLISNGKMMEGVQIISNENEEKKLNFCGFARHLENNSINEPKEEKISAKKAKKLERSSSKSARKRKKSKVEYLGRLNYVLSYDFKQCILSVHIVQAQQLPGLDFSGLSDPYVKVYLMPDKRRCERTRVHKSNLNPVFEETFQFHMPFTELTSKTLVMAVYDYDRFSKHDEIGQVSIPIGKIDLTQTKDEWKDLKRITDADSGQVSFDNLPDD